MLNDYMDEVTYDSTNKTSKQSVVGTAGTAIIGGKVKDGGAAGDWASGNAMKAVARTVDALVGATGGVQVDVVTDTAPGLATSPTVLATKTITAAQFTANALFEIGKLAPGTRKRYLGVKLTPLTTNSTAGSIIVWLVPDEDATPQNRVNSI